jgi:hypothetical protein
MTYTKPYQQRVCEKFESKDASSCAIDFNNNMCQSCKTEVRTYEDEYEYNGNSYMYTYQQRCFQFDCTDNEGGHSGNTCDRNVATIQYNIVFGDDCARCLACGVGFKMTQPENSGDFPVVGQYQCSGLELGSILGYFDRSLCNQIQAATFETCGCEPLFYDPDFVDQPTMNTTEEEACYICGHPDAVMTNFNAFLPLPNHNTTCAEFAASAMMGKYSSIYCTEEIQPRAKRFCGCVDPILPSDESMFHSGSLETPEAGEGSDEEETATSGGYICNICGPDETMVNHDTFVDLDNGVSTCAGIDAAGKAGFFEEKYCLDEIIPRTKEQNCCLAAPMDAAFPVEEPTTEPSPPTIPFGSNRLDASKIKEIETLPSLSNSVTCEVCGPDLVVETPNNFIPLPTGVTTCSAFAEAGLVGVLKETFCLEEAQALAKIHCGCVKTTEIVAKDLSATGNHFEYPEEVDIGNGAEVDSSSPILSTFLPILSCLIIVTVTTFL